MRTCHHSLCHLNMECILFLFFSSSLITHRSPALLPWISLLHTVEYSLSFCALWYSIPYWTTAHPPTLSPSPSPVLGSFQSECFIVTSFRSEAITPSHCLAQVHAPCRQGSPHWRPPLFLACSPSIPAHPPPYSAHSICPFPL